MTTDTIRPKRFLLVDDDAQFLAVTRELFSTLAGGSWEIFTAQNHAQALALLQRQLMDVIVLDINMPVMDGVQFLRLLGRTHPDQQVVMLTGHATEENRKACLEAGAVLFLQKPTAQGELAGIFAALDALAGAAPQEGFQGRMQRVGLHEVLQLECLGRRSSVLEVFTGKARGKIFIHEGAIVHTEFGTVQGEVALYSLLALRGGEFNLQPFAEPPRRTIETHWEMLLMESARLGDESAAASAAAAETPAPRAAETIAPPLPEGAGVRVLEIVLCSGAGEVLYDWECKSLERRLGLIAQIEQHATQLSGFSPVGRFDRVEILARDGRIVCQIQPHRRLFVRSAPARAEAA